VYGRADLCVEEVGSCGCGRCGQAWLGLPTGGLDAEAAAWVLACARSREWRNACVWSALAWPTADQAPLQATSV
jgi:hypothetical protein